MVTTAQIKRRYFGTAASLSAFILPLVLLLSGRLSAQETVLPQGFNIEVEYDLSSTAITIHDTLFIGRTITNTESFALQNLYVAENLPLEFEILDWIVTVDSVPLNCDYSGPIPDQVLPTFNSYRWVIDHPPPPDSIARPLYPGETLNVGYAVVCYQPGEYTLPFHTFCCCGDTCGLFTIAGSLAISVLPGSSIDDESDEQLPRNLSSFAYPNPFNSRVAIRLEGATEPFAQFELSIFDINGKQVFQRQYGPREGRGNLYWHPDGSIASGAYFYKITGAERSTQGMIILLK